MNISPINLMNFKSTVRNTQSSQQANEVSATSPINVSVSSEALKANFCPQIAFKGKEDIGNTIKLSLSTLTKLYNESYIITKEEMDPDLAEKLESGTATKEDLLNILKTANESGDTVAHRLAKKGKAYIEITKNFTPEERLELLKTAENIIKQNVAQNLATNKDESFIEATKDFTPEERLELLKTHDDFNHTVAHVLAYCNPEAYLKATQDYTKEERLELLKMPNEWRTTVAHELALAPELYAKATQDYTKEERLELLKMTDKDREIVAHNLTRGGMQFFKDITKDFRREEIIDLLDRKNIYGYSVGYLLAYYELLPYLDSKDNTTPQET